MRVHGAWKFLPSLKQAVLFIAIFCVIRTESAQAFSVYNRTSASVEAKIVSGGTWQATIPAGGDKSCNWSDVGCTGGQRGTSLTLELTLGTFQCDIELISDGYVHIHEVDRSTFVDGNGTPLFAANYPKIYYCQSNNNADQAVAIIPTGVKDGAHASRSVHFLATGDPQFNNGDTINIDVTTNLLVSMKKKMVGDMRGMIISGDLTMNAQKQEFDAYRGALSGQLRWVYDGMGNHDYGEKDKQEGTAKSNNDAACAFAAPGCVDSDAILQDIASRRRSTPRTNQGGTGGWGATVSNMHYSWDWHDVHFVQLNLCAMDNEWNPDGDRYSPFGALSFLKSDLERFVGPSGRPVVIVQHIRPNWEMEQDRTALWNAIAPYNVIAFVVGHDHPNFDSEWATAFCESGNDCDGKSSIPVLVAGSAFDNDYVYTEHAQGDDKIVAYLELFIDKSQLTVKRWASDGRLVVTKAYDIPPKFVIVNKMSGLCLDPFGSGAASGDDVGMSRCDGGRDQLFHHTKRAELRSLVSGNCLDAGGYEGNALVDVGIYNCESKPDQTWSAPSMQIDAGWTTIKNLAKNTCLEAEGDAKGGANVRIATCDGSDHQSWKLTRLPF